MKRTSRVLAAALSATALMFSGVHTADARPSHAKGERPTASQKGADRHGGGTSKLERDVARTIVQLERTVSEQRLRRVDPAHAATVVANVDADQAALAALVAPATTPTDGASTAPPSDARATLRTYRVANYRLAVNILRQAAQAGQTTEAETLALEESVALALAITATSTKAEVRAARTAFVDAGELLEDGTDEADEAEDSDGTDDADGTDGTGGTEPVEGNAG